MGDIYAASRPTSRGSFKSVEAGSSRRRRRSARLLACRSSSSPTGLSFSWNILDFGVSYFVARQSADRVMIALERRRKVEQNLVRDVRSAYWRSAAAQVLGGQIDRSIKEAEAALATSRSVENEALRSPTDFGILIVGDSLTQRAQDRLAHGVQCAGRGFSFGKVLVAEFFD